MTSAFRLLPILLFVLASCTRPVVGRDVGATFLTDLNVDPTFIRADVPIRLSFRAIGDTIEQVTYELGNGTSFDCDPIAEGDRLVCTHPGLTIGEFSQGPSVAVVAAVDGDGKRSIATTPITIDFDCPRFLALSVAPTIARIGDTAVVSIEASEPLAGAPRVSRAGRVWDIIQQRNPASFAVSHPITVMDPSSFENVVVSLTDRAGNTSMSCGETGEVPFAVDSAPPNIDPNLVTVTRGAPGTATIIEAAPRAFLDDVQIAEVRVVDVATGLLLSTVVPAEDGSLEPTNLGAMSGGRVTVEAIDRLVQTTGPVAVPERWRLSLGSASSPGAAVRSAARKSPAAPGSRFMRDRTIELAPALLAADARSAVVRARVGFETSGQLPNAYEDVFWIAGGYDEIGSSIVTFGGQKLIDDVETYFSRTVILRWNDRTGVYDFESGPPNQLGSTPAGRGAHRIAFDGNGCGIMFGGDGFRERNGVIEGVGALNDVWQICRQVGGNYQWRRITPINESGNGFPLIRRTPIIYDPGFDRYVIVGGYSNAGGLFPIDGVMFLEPGNTFDDWTWVDVTPLPTSFGERHSHMLYYDSQLGAAAVGLGYVVPRARAGDFWAYQGGQWVNVGTVPPNLEFRQGFGYDYDRARGQVVVWGDNDSPTFDANTLFLSGTATNASSGWRSANLDPPVPRAHPTLVYDPDRETTIAFGGLRFDARFVPPTIYSIISEPSYPYLATEVDLAAARPVGVERLSLTIRAAGYGDGDRTGPGAEVRGGVIVKLWDHNAGQWVDVANRDTSPGGALATIEIDVSERADRFVSPTGVVPITVVTRWPGTEAVESQLEVDQIDGWLELRAGVTL